MPWNRSVAVALFVALAALSTLLIAVPAQAEDLQAELEAKQSKLDEVGERKGVLTTTISRYGDEIEQLTGEVAAIRTREAAVRVRLEAKQAELDQAVAELEIAHDRLIELRARLKRALVALRERLVAMYETGSPDVLSVIVSSGDVDDLAARAEYLDRLHGMDEAIVGRVRDLRDEVQELVTRLRSAKERIEAARDAIASEQQALIDARAALQGRQQQLVDARHRRESALAQISSHEEELHDDVASIQGEIAAQLATSGSAPLPAGPIVGGSGGLIWPVNGAIVSGFGPRWGSMHEGVDIAVPEMTPIRAAASGTVVLLQSDAESGGYGNFTCLDHGGGLSTCYAHQTSFAVSAGQSVSQGDIIGYTGCTGHCLGPHLHFEVRINGSPTDPMGYL
ncbi:MAG TPA: peptidoglycan DD-metalloendopeptidase family protein [Solirubrobacterales bacterium]|nr:peptidoglycan DD-metalloendopeptidase family protein [Solirubrobacterales bacterium]